MSKSFWDDLSYFRPTEGFGDPDKMNEAFMRKLDAFRGSLSHQIKILEGYATNGHAENSYHYQGLAVDCRLLDKKGHISSLADHIIAAMKSPFGGIGIYTWSPIGPFLHLDDRLIYERRRIWVCQVKGRYETLSEQFLSKIGSNSVV